MLTFPPLDHESLGSNTIDAILFTLLNGNPDKQATSTSIIASHNQQIAALTKSSLAPKACCNTHHTCIWQNQSRIHIACQKYAFFTGAGICSDLISPDQFKCELLKVTCLTFCSTLTFLPIDHEILSSNTNWRQSTHSPRILFEYFLLWHKFCASSLSRTEFHKTSCSVWNWHKLFLIRFRCILAYKCTGFLLGILRLPW